MLKEVLVQKILKIKNILINREEKKLEEQAQNEIDENNEIEADFNEGIDRIE